MSSAADSSKTLFISDLHLDPERPAVADTLIKFLSDSVDKCDSLYVLGDLFEVWVGDDDDHPMHERVCQAFGEFSQKVPLYLMHGNRDFLLGEAWASRCGATLLDDPTVIDCHGRRIALLHGDSLCTRDKDYMKFRQQVRSARWQQDFLERSLLERHMVAGQVRQQSMEANSNKASDIMDVTQEEVINLLEKLQVNLMIHGHTHRPAVHTIRLQKPINGQLEAQRLVLGSWDSKAWVLEVSDSDLNLRPFPLLSSQASGAERAKAPVK